MNADDYKKVKDIFHSVLEMEPQVRHAFLDEKLAGESGLRGEVERLLGSYDSEYLESPISYSRQKEAQELPSGYNIGHYRIVEKIGSGGMGHVYLAEDLKLGRRVALKLLLPEFTADPDRLHRFRQEARAASALNHPSILTIFDIGETEAASYIATEFIEGETLRARLCEERLNVLDALDIAVQVAGALAAAHEAGIVHRDIKPENIMLRPDGFVKVLDFGIAKLSDRTNHIVSPEAPTERHFETAPGMVIGTVRYMSPEQARGRTTDGRTDIWSLGCLLYEMLAGRAPFDCETPADQIAEIVKSDPPPLRTFTSAIPERLEEIVLKSLQRDPDDRYRNAKDLLGDLKILSKKLELELEAPGVNGREPKRRRFRKPAQSKPPSSAPARDLATVSSAEYLIWGIKAHRLTTAGIVLFVLSLLGVTAYLVRTYWRNPNEERMVYANKIRLAAQALETSNLPYAKQLLDETKPTLGEEDLRGFEWGYLSGLYAEREASQPLTIPQENWVGAVAFSPDGRNLAGGGWDNTVRLWDVATGELVRALSGHGKAINGLNFAADGNTLLSVGADRSARVWEAATGRELLVIGGENDPLSWAVLSPDGKSIAGASGGKIRLWDARTGREQPARFPQLEGDLLIVFSPDGKNLAARGSDQTIHVFEPKTARLRRKFPQAHSGWVTDLRFSPDSKFILTGSTDGTAKLWDLISGKEVRSFRGPSAETYDVAFSPDGKLVAAGYTDDSIRIWDADKAHEIVNLKGHLNRVDAIAFSPDGRKLASGGVDNTIRLWQISTNEPRGVLRGHTAAVNGIAFSKDGSLLASASSDRTAKIWDAASERDRLTLTGHSEAVNSAVFSPDGRTLVTAGQDKKIRFWEVKNGHQRMSFDAGRPGDASYSPDGRVIATTHFLNGPDVTLWDAGTGRRICSFPASAWGVEFSADSKRITASTGANSIRIWESTSCTEIRNFSGGPNDEYAAAFTAAGKLIGLQILNNGRSLKLIDPELGEELSSIRGHDALLLSGRLSPDGKRLVTTGRDRTLKIWDVVTGQEVLSISVPSGDMEETAFSPDGKILAAAASDGTIRLWRSAGRND